LWSEKSEAQIRGERFKQEFEVCDETGAWLFTTHGCFNRHNRDRAQEELTLRENSIVSFEYYRSDDMQESVLISYVAQLQAMDIPLSRGDKTLEEYVLNHRHKLDMKQVFVEHLKSVIMG
jgi:hypothetical protein